MLIFSSISPKNILYETNESYIVYNLSSLFESYEKVNILPSYDKFIDYDNLDFDIVYLNYIFNNDFIFIEFMDKIILPLYRGNNVILLVSNEFPFYSITESLIKLIQQRYSIQSNMVNDISDISVLQENYFDDIGIYNLDVDRMRYLKLKRQV